MKEKSALDVLLERGFVGQMTHEDEIRELLDKEKITFYIGFDPTADSLTVGHFLPIMAMAHMQRAGHRPIALIGGGTTMVGDPTDKTDMRKMLTLEQIAANGERFKTQMSKFMDFSEGKAIMANNADWLLNLNYVEFLRDIGAHFSVNRMLTADCYKSRMEKGLTFLEFNYMIMQSYDFLVLHDLYNCCMQMGGNDQWSNILGGVDLIRRKKSKPAFGVTFNLLTTSEGKKMGKTEKGAIWLDEDKTSIFDFFQYFRNVDDADVIHLLKRLTFLEMDEILAMEKWEGSELNHAKEILAFEVTKIVHGEVKATEALKAAKALFSGGSDASTIPTVIIDKNEFGESMPILELLLKINFIPSKGEGRRLITQNGISVNDVKIIDVDHSVKYSDFEAGHILVKKGKKQFASVTLA